MKKILLLVLVSLCSSSFSATVKWSEIIKTGNRAPAPSVIGQDGQQIYLVRYASRNKLILSTYQTRNLASTKSLPLKLEYKGQKLSYIGGYMIDNQPIIATSFYNKKDKVMYFFAHLVKSNLSVGKPVLLGSIPIFSRGIAFGYAPGIGTGIDFEVFHVSGDKKNAFSLFNQGDKENPSKKYKGMLLNNNLEKIATPEFNLPYFPDNFVRVSEELGTDGVFYILGYNTVEGREKGLFKRTTEYRDKIWIYAIDSETGFLESTVVETETDVEQIGLKISKNGNVMFSALTGAETGGVNGSMCILYDNALLELNRSFTPFESDFVKTTYSERQLKKQAKKEKKANAKGEKKPEPEFYNYDMKHIVESEDGSFTVFAEQWYIEVTTTTTTNSNGGTSTTTTLHYYYNDIIAVNFDRDGRYQWKNVIEKRQHSVNDAGFYSSFFPIVDGNDFGLIFNTKEIHNLNKEELSYSEKKSASRKTVCMNVTVGNDGTVKKDELFSFDESDKLAIAPRYSSQTASGDVVIFAKNRKGSKIGVIQL